MPVGARSPPIPHAGAILEPGVEADLQVGPRQQGRRTSLPTIGAIILAGVRIHSRSVIGAGSVVTRDVPEDVFAAGNPCRVIRPISE